MNRLLNTVLLMFVVISSIHAASLRNERAAQNNTDNDDFLTEPKEISSDAVTRPILALIAQPFLLTESTTRRPTNPRPFHLWWSIFTQSILQLRRQRATTTEAPFSFDPNRTSISTTSIPNFHTEDVAHNTNDIAAGLETISIEVPVFDLMPLE